jgi:hypothetical protein
MLSSACFQARKQVLTAGALRGIYLRLAKAISLSYSPMRPQMSKQPKKRPIFHVCIAADNTYMVNHQKTDGLPPEKILVPFLIASDPRMFVRSGELIKPYEVIEFKLLRLESFPEVKHDMAIYNEVSRTEFNPSGCVPIQYFDISKLDQQLNAANALLEARIPDAPADAA